ncbi:glutamine amidotransferase [Desertibaculum subflavum]|uniref:glutamine amidotransferase n=1 Tax=Desertibaculum subflavum TaxID=2268458 RepID=UPI000E665AE3
MNKRALAIRHVAFEDLGLLAPLLAARGYAVEYREAGIDDLGGPVVQTADLLVVLGGPIGVYETGKYPFLSEEIAAIERRLAAGRPMLGFCLGAQLMARALDCRVYPGPAKEIGFAPLTLTEAGAAGPLRHLGAEPVLHWHGDNFDLPREATRLASTPVCRNQAFALGTKALALQFHAEADLGRIEAWLIGHTAELAAAGIDVPTLRAEAARVRTGLHTRGRAMLTAWLDAAGL